MILLHPSCILERLYALETLHFRLNGIQEVSGSIPLISTTEKTLKFKDFSVFSFFLQN